MTSKSSSTNVEQLVNAKLDQANAALPLSVRQDIAAARIQAQAKAQRPGIASTFHWHSGWSTAIASVGVALAVVVLVSYQANPVIPAIPAALLAEEIPLEDLAMLEELEFANWLAEQEEVLL